MYCLLFLTIGVISLFGYLLQGSMFGISGENLTKRLRSLSFEKILSQEVAWFESTSNDVGSLATVFACARVKFFYSITIAL